MGNMAHVPISPLSYGSNIGCTSNTDHRLPWNGNQSSGRSRLGSLIIAWSKCIFAYLSGASLQNMVRETSHSLSHGSKMSCMNSTAHSFPLNEYQPSGRSGLGSVIIAWNQCIFIYLDRWILVNMVRVSSIPLSYGSKIGCTNSTAFQLA